MVAALSAYNSFFRGFLGEQCVLTLSSVATTREHDERVKSSNPYVH